METLQGDAEFTGIREGNIVSTWIGIPEFTGIREGNTVSTRIGIPVRQQGAQLPLQTSWFQLGNHSKRLPFLQPS